MTAAWDADLYRRFERERTRPAADLLAQVELERPDLVVDLGCGPGNSTELLVRRFPGAAVTGVDTSPDMLEAARRRLPDCRFEEADLATWRPPEPVDLLFANASLQWVSDHALLVPRLLALLRPGGVLAVQMPDNRNEPSHALMRAAAAEAPWAAFAPGPGSRPDILRAERYDDLLTGAGCTVNLWRTIYQHRLASAASIVDWVRGTGLRPFVEAIPAEHRPGFLARYETLVEAAYRPRADGHRLLAFPRLFFVARTAG